MKSTALLMMAIFLASCSTPAPHPAEKHAQRVHARSSHVRHTATRSDGRIGPNSFGVPFGDLLSRFAHDSTKESDGYLWVLKAGKPLFGLSDKNDLQDRKVRLIYLISPDIQVANGVHAGMPITALLQQYPDLKLEIGYQDDEMFALSIATGAGKTMVVLAIVRSDSGDRLALDDSAPDAAGRSPYPTRHFSTAGHIDHLLIFAPAPRQ